MAIRDQKRLAKALGVDERGTAFLVEVAHAAGLLDLGGPHRDEWLPSREFDAWREQPLPERWACWPPAGWTRCG